MSSAGHKGDRAFELLCGIARRGERCPSNDDVPGAPQVFGVMARAGRIRVEVFEKNFRRVTILEGPDRGKKTAPPPLHKDGSMPQPYLVNDKDGLRRNGRIVESPKSKYSRPQPSAPRLIQIGKIKP